MSGVQDTEQDSERSHQMAALRCLCLPRLSFLLLSVLQNSSRHQEALRLADIISSDQHRLYQVQIITHTGLGSLRCFPAVLRVFSVPLRSSPRRN